MKILVTGATGYVGGRLIPRLLKKGYQVRAAARNLSKLKGRYWSDHENLELAVADVLNYNSTLKALQGCDVAYYLVHSMTREEQEFEKLDREAALNFVAAAETAGLKRLVYLGGLGKEEDQLSRHLQSRHEVGAIFKQSKIPTTIFRAAMIIGSGSASFEILRYLVDRLPVMITPRWVRSSCQPIAIADVLEYLIRTLEVEETTGKTFDIGGPEIVTYQELMNIYAEEAGLPKRKILRVKVLSPWLSSHWIGLITPLPPSLGKPLVEGLSNTVICEESRIKEVIPQTLLTPREAIRKAIEKIRQNQIETSWTDAGIIPPAEWVDQNDPKWAGGTIFQKKNSIIIDESPEKIWKTLLKIGGRTGWYASNWLWRLRGWIDKISGGVGLARGRRNMDQLQVGDAVDFWRVNVLQQNQRLLLVAEMKLPGEAALEFCLHPINEDRTELTILARFLPKGLMGISYWYLLFPFHFWIFSRMLRKISEGVKKEVE